MYDQTQLLKGTLEGCILKVISLKTTYGYEIVTGLSRLGFPDIKEGTIYPLLIRLEKKGLVSSEFRPSELGPSRKYYTLTGEGKALLREFIITWAQISDSINHILELEELT